MNSYSYYKIIPDKRLILEYYSGEVQIQTIIDQKLRIGSEKDYKPSFNIIHDFREATFLICEEEGLHFLDFLKNTKSIYSERKVIHLTNTPEQVITTTLFNMLIKDSQIKTETVSTLYAAITLLGMSLEDYSMIEANLDEIKKNTSLFDKDK